MGENMQAPAALGIILHLKNSTLLVLLFQIYSQLFSFIKASFTNFTDIKAICDLRVSSKLLPFLHPQCSMTFLFIIIFYGLYMSDRRHEQIVRLNIYRYGYRNARSKASDVI